MQTFYKNSQNYNPTILLIKEIKGIILGFFWT